MNKGQLMKLVYSKKELRNIDSAIPVEYYSVKPRSTRYLVMNYNNSNFGILEHLLVIARKRNIHIQN